MNAFESADQRSVEVDGTRVQYYVDGPEEARPIVLVHGVGIDSATVSWREAFPALAEDYRVYALDLPGYGGSDSVPDTVVPDTTYYAGVLGDFLEALDYTFASPARISRLVLVASYVSATTSRAGNAAQPT